MGDFIVVTNVLGSFSTNSYLVYDTESREAVLIDPPSNAEYILDMLKNQRLALRAILLTHGHIDHMGAVPAIKAVWQDAIVYAAREEEEVLQDGTKNLSAVFGEPLCLQADAYLRDAQTLTLLGRPVSCKLVPGHTQGGMCYYFETEDTVFSGDTLFAGSVGRSDFPTGSAAALIRGITDKLFVLPGHTKVYPGHGPATTIRTEQQENPFF